MKKIKFEVEIEYDKEANAAYVYFIPSQQVSNCDSQPVFFLDEISYIIIDFDENKKIVGMELLNADKCLPEIILEKLK